MTDQDLFFTHTIVGPARSVELGRPLTKKDLRFQRSGSAVAVSMVTSTLNLSQFWREWCLIQGAYPYPGRPRHRPRWFRRALERHALVLSFVALVAIVCAVALVLVTLYFPHLLEPLAEPIQRLGHINN